MESGRVGDAENGVNDFAAYVGDVKIFGAEDEGQVAFGDSLEMEVVGSRSSGLCAIEKEDEVRKALGSRQHGLHRQQLRLMRTRHDGVMGREDRIGVDEDVVAKVMQAWVYELFCRAVPGA